MRHLLRALLLISATAAFAQTTTSQEISGLVQDVSGAVAPNVTVSAKNTETGLTRTAQSNESGFYLISNLPIGIYEVSAEAEGFKKFVTTGVVLTVNSKLAVNVKLEVGNVTESVTVAADAAQVETTT